MNEIMTMSNENIVSMTSLEVVNLINSFRKEEGNEVLKKHDDMLKSIRKEIEVLKNAGIKDIGNFSETTYKDSYNRSNPCYKMNKAGIMQILNKESALVRYKTQQYIEALENKIKHQHKPLSTMELLELEFKAIREQNQKIKEVKQELDEFKLDIPLFQVECKELQAEVRKKGTKCLGGYKSVAYKDNSLRGKVYADIQRQLKREFGIERYEAIKRSQYEVAIKIVSNYKLPLVLEEKVKLKNNQLAFA